MQDPVAPAPEAVDFAAGAHPLLRLQRAVGNRSVQRMVRPHETGAAEAAPVGAGTLLLGPADDRCERDADRVADLADRGRVPPQALASRRAHGAGTSGVILPDVQRAIAQASRGDGRPIPEAVRAPLERAMGAQFDRVRVHTGQNADNIARSLRARAFTTGQDIFFRRGQYEPSTRSGQRVLAHELTHVVQQATPAPQSDRGLVQRSVGFEFETDWGVHDRSDPAQEPRKGKKLKKHTPYKQGQGFTVQVDEASRGFRVPDYAGLKRQIEFVVDPHDESKEGGNDLQQTMRALVAEAKILQRRRTNRKPDQKGFRYPGANQDMWVFPDAKETATPGIHARGQATVGLSLPAISRLGLMGEDELRATERRGGFPVSHAHRAASLRGHRDPFILGARAAAQIEGASEGFAGLVTLLVHYIKVFHYSGTAREDYVKGHLPLLAKTNFAAMFRHLPKADQEQYRDDPQAFVTIILESVNKDPTFAVYGNMPVIPYRLLREGSVPLDLTLKTWLSGIPGGQDRLTSRFDRRLFGLGDLGKGPAKGKKTDVAPGKGPPRMILEFRAGSPKGWLTPPEWLEFAFDYFNLARRLHTRAPVAEWQEPRPKPKPDTRRGRKPGGRATVT